MSKSPGSCSSLLLFPPPSVFCPVGSRRGEKLSPITPGRFFFFLFFPDGNPPDKGVCLGLTGGCLFNLVPSVTDLSVCVKKEEKKGVQRDGKEAEGRVCVGGGL